MRPEIEVMPFSVVDVSDATFWLTLTNFMVLVAKLMVPMWFTVWVPFKLPRNGPVNGKLAPMVKPQVPVVGKSNANADAVPRLKVATASRRDKRFFMFMFLKKSPCPLWAGYPILEQV